MRGAELSYQRMLALCKKAIGIVRGRLLAMVHRTGGSCKIMGKVYIDAPNLKLGRNVILYPNVHIFGPGKIEIGNNVVIGDGTVICAAKSIVIGDDSMIAGQCYIIDCNHGMHLGEAMRLQPMSIKSVEIANDCWIGAGAKVLAGAVVESGAVVGAGEVVRGTIKQETINCSETTFNAIRRR